MDDEESKILRFFGNASRFQNARSMVLRQLLELAAGKY